MKNFIIAIGSILFVFALFLLQSFALASIISFLLGFIEIHEIMGYNATYFLFIIFLIFTIIKGTFSNSSK